MHKLPFSPQMGADGTQIMADKFTFGRMWDRSAHPSNPLRLRRRNAKTPARPGRMGTDTIDDLSQWCLWNIFICVLSVFICVHLWLH